ncbi:AAA family ATPase [Microbispora sp. RL4-1S]|uniref:AAA family ATPase n=1 Tax=Microbispora oryzae TaxID=2806554 RepID=A0A940WPW9_9ACTN|nr:YhaN family protein [Microbispora oryzae]MBP2707392.1 AAA family ATPase [Microbispora oryzae]
MRIERLDLIAYGAFADFSLDLAAPGVHLVFGSNEAGKSTTRGALDQLLYGIDERSRYGFKHGLRNLQLGARLSSADGTVIDIARYKRRKNPLLDSSGRPINQEALAPFLGGIDRRTFITEFALDSEELRKGGELLASGDGGMTELLAAARSGTQLNAALQGIERRQRDLYLKGGQKPLINANLTQLKGARQSLHLAVLRPQDYREADRAVAEAERELATVEAVLREKKRRLTELERLSTMLPMLAQQSDLSQRIAGIEAEGVIAPSNIREKLPELLGEQREFAAELRAHHVRLESLERQLSEIELDERVLRHADAIDRLVKELAAIQDAVERQVRSSGEAARIREQAERRLRMVHPEASLADVRLFRIPRALVEQARGLRDRGRTVADDCRRAAETVDRWRHKREQGDKELSELPLPEDASELRTAHNAVPDDLLSTFVETETTAEQTAKRFGQLLKLLGLPDLAPAEALVMRVPTWQQIEEATAKTHELEQARRDLLKDRDKDQQSLDSRRRKLARFIANDAPPTRRELDEIRGRRDELITRLLEDPTQKASALSAIEQADRTADAMIQHAKKVADRMALEREIAELEDTIPGYQTRLEVLDTAEADAQRSWEALWNTYPAKTPTMIEGSHVLDQIDQLRAFAQELQDTHVSLTHQQRRIEEHSARLRKLLRMPSSDPELLPGETTDLSRLLELVEVAQDRLEEHRRIADIRAASEATLKNAEANLAEAEVSLAAAKQTAADHEREWEKFLQRVGLPTDRDADTALADLERLGQVAQNVDEADEADRTARQDNLRIAEFRDLLDATARACGHDLPSSPAVWHLVVEPLAQALTEQRRAGELREQLIDQQRELTAQIAEANASVIKIQSFLDDFIVKLGVSSAADLELSVERASRVKEDLAKLATLKEALPQGEELRALSQQAAVTSDAEVEAELAELRDEIGKLEEHKSQWTERAAEKRQDLGRLNGSPDAARVAADIAQICAELADDAEEYLRLEVARRAILTCMEDYRNADQAPVLARAAEVFRVLTCDRYTGLELSDEERPSILAKAHDGALLAGAELSEGTRDQLYLALRLATLERHADAGNALPFAVDDIFITFDEERTAAGLRVLNDLAGRFQVIVFTHHQHVVATAVKELPPDRVHVHLLPR